ncbi:MAG: hypothetical protein NC114_11855 [Ruminococcus flavefaciens]|nr:hypothetical protein [Ruminococcus flavefaciens]
MTLSCDWYETDPDCGFSYVGELLPAKYDCCCVSCHKPIKAGEDCLEFDYWRRPTEAELELKDSSGKPLYDESDDVDEGVKHNCRTCGEAFLNLSELGYIVQPENSLSDLHEYWRETGFDPKRYSE